MINAKEIAALLNARPSGRGWIARCPAHDDRSPSLSITVSREGRAMLKCFAGCPTTDVFTALRLHRVGGTHSSRAADLPAPLGGRTSNIAAQIWEQGQPLRASVAARYLASRGLNGSETEALRFHRRLRHPSATFWPGMIAQIVHGVTGEPMGLHRTFVKADGSGKAPVEPAKMMLGPSAGGAVRLAAAGPRLMIGEGIETVLSGMQAARLPGWAALSTSGLGSLGLPREVEEVIILADADPAGERAAERAARRWSAEGRRVRIARPPDGMDFNDVLVANGGGNGQS
jgi:putative DNA primase/helicase